MKWEKIIKVLPDFDTEVLVWDGIDFDRDHLIEDDTGSFFANDKAGSTTHWSYIEPPITDKEG